LPVVPSGGNGQTLQVRTEEGETFQVKEIQCLQWNLGLLIVSTMRQQKHCMQKTQQQAWAQAARCFHTHDPVAQTKELAIIARCEIERQLSDVQQRAETNRQAAETYSAQQLRDSAGNFPLCHIAAYRPPWQSFVYYGVYADLYQEVWLDKGVSSYSATTPQSIWKSVGCLRPGLERLCAEAIKAWLHEQNDHRWAKSPADRNIAVQNGWPRTANEYPVGYGPCQPPGFCFDRCNCMDDSRPQEMWELEKKWLADESGWQKRAKCVSLALCNLLADTNAEFMTFDPLGCEVPWHCKESRSKPGEFYYYRQNADTSQFAEPAQGHFIQPSIEHPTEYLATKETRMAEESLLAHEALAKQRSDKMLTAQARRWMRAHPSARAS